MLARPDQKEPAACQHLHGAFRRRAGLDGRFVRANVVVPFFCARHDHIAGLDLARSWVRGGVIGRHLACTAETKQRPRRGFQRVTTFKHYQPARIIEGPELASDVLDGSALERLFGGDDTDDTLEKLVSAMLKTYCAYAGRPEALPGEALLRDAFARMAGWQLPGLARAGDTPVTAALRAALWIRRTAANPSADFFRAFHPQGHIVERLQPVRRPIRRDDCDAARIVIHHAISVGLRATAQKQRWRAVTPAGNYLADWTIIKAVLDEGLSARDVALRLGLDHAGITRRVNDAIARVANSLGQTRWPLSHQTPKFVRRVERHDKPAFRLGPRPERLAIRGDEIWLIDEVLQYLGPVRVPPGCAISYPDEKPRARAAVQRWNPDDDPDEDGTTRSEPGLWTEGRHVISAQRAADWPAIAAALPAGERATALATEDIISRVLNDRSPHERDRNPFHPTSKKEDRFARTFSNAGIADLRAGSKNGGRRDCTSGAWRYQGIHVAMRDRPRRFEVCAPGYDDAAPPQRPRLTDEYCGLVVWRHGELVPRRDDGRRVKGAVDEKFKAAVSGGGTDHDPIFH